ncbi:E3 ubiquitin-protein ligase RNF180 isoform X4 [Fundulus heteroclitus]|uniref:E3 ubiquitin-protein ligase RNF180 isoform X4 n=1 Tax=Fundulus heteroclitus TaxID=8078 RepID=UPI00165B6BAA|nr:E3 ubiquitin-protein ligase RNF180 isoform X4 [Fundulus heteroclitus]
MDGTTLRCRRCRRTVIDSTCLLTAADESPAAGCSIWHIDADNLPEWILSSVQQALWTAGKLTCHHCGARLGGFSFLGRSDCPCGRGAAVHLSKSRVDLDHRRRVLLVQPRRSETGQAHLLADLSERREEASLDGSRLARLPRLAPVDPPGAGGISQRGAAGLADTPESGSSVRHSAELQSDSDGEAWSDVLPWVPDISGGPSLSVELQQTGDVCLRRRHTSERGAGQEEEEEEEEEEEDRALSSLSARIRRSKRDKNRLKSLRRKQRRRERWLQSQMKEDESSTRRQRLGSRRFGPGAGRTSRTPRVLVGPCPAPGNTRASFGLIGEALRPRGDAGASPRGLLASMCWACLSTPSSTWTPFYSSLL